MDFSVRRKIHSTRDKFLPPTGITDFLLPRSILGRVLALDVSSDAAGNLRIVVAL